MVEERVNVRLFEWCAVISDSGRGESQCQTEWCDVTSDSGRGESQCQTV